MIIDTVIMFIIAILIVIAFSISYWSQYNRLSRCQPFGPDLAWMS